MEKKTKKTKKLKLVSDKLTEENMEQVYKDKFEKINLLLDDPDYNSYLNQKELLNIKNISKQEDKFNTLYPSLDDPMFNIKIAQKKNLMIINMMAKFMILKNKLKNYVMPILI